MKKKIKSKAIKKTQDKFDRRLTRLEVKVIAFISKCYEGDGTKEWRASVDKLADGVVHCLSKCMVSVHTLPKRDSVEPDQPEPNWPLPNWPLPDSIPEEIPPTRQ